MNYFCFQKLAWWHLKESLVHSVLVQRYHIRYFCCCWLKRNFLDICKDSLTGNDTSNLLFCPNIFRTFVWQTGLLLIWKQAYKLSAKYQDIYLAWFWKISRSIACAFALIPKNGRIKFRSAVFIGFFILTFSNIISHLEKTFSNNNFLHRRKRIASTSIKS